MSTDDIFGNDPELCSSIHPLEQIEENFWSKGGHQMSIMDEAQFDFELPPLTLGENSLYSSSSEDYGNTEGSSQIPHQHSVNYPLLNMPSPSVETLLAQNAFTTYVKASPTAAIEFSPGGHILHKRCFRFLSAIQKKNDRATQMSSVKAPASNNNRHQKSRTDSSIGHVIADHFSNLYSLRPERSKRDKDSILVNTISHLRELKLYVAELGHQN